MLVSGHSWKRVMSPRFFTEGYRCSSNAHAKGSISEKKIGVQPSGCQATAAASIPEQTLPYLTDASSQFSARFHCRVILVKRAAQDDSPFWRVSAERSVASSEIEDATSAPDFPGAPTFCSLLFQLGSEIKQLLRLYFGAIPNQLLQLRCKLELPASLSIRLCIADYRGETIDCVFSYV